MRKRVLYVLILCLALCMTMSALSACDSDEDGKASTTTTTQPPENPPEPGEGDGQHYSKGLEYTLSSDQTYYILSDIRSCTDPNVVIPSDYQGLPVKSIGNETFWDCGILSVTIPDFSNCKDLTSATIGNSVTSIGEWAFFGCRRMTSIILGSSVTRIDDDAFSGCANLVEIYNQSDLPLQVGDWVNYGRIGENAKHIYTVEGSSKLSKTSDGLVLYTNGDEVLVVNYIGMAAEVTIPDTVTGINHYAFYGCEELTSVTIRHAVTRIDDCAFYHCAYLSSISIGNSVTSIGESVFWGCTSLTDIYFGGTEEEWNAFTEDMGLSDRVTVHFAK